MAKKTQPKPRELTGPSLAVHRPDLFLSDVLGLLPDPDPVLAKLSDGGDSMLSAAAADGVVYSLIQTRKSATLNREFRIEPGKGATAASKAWSASTLEA